jgi:hypothetical protein
VDEVKRRARPELAPAGGQGTLPGMHDEVLGLGRRSRRLCVFAGAIVAVALALAACGADESDSGTGPLDASPGDASTANSTLGRDTESCEVVSSTPVAWTEETEWGTPESLFTPFSGTCTAPFTWDGSGWTSELSVTPATGESTVTVIVEIDPDSVKRVEYTPTETGGGMYLDDPCAPTLEATATVTLELPEGSVVTGLEATIDQGSTASYALLSVSVAENDFGDWIEITPQSDNTVASMLIEMSPLADTCAGSISLTAVTETTSGGTGISQGTGVAGSFASWSDTGCPVGQTPVTLDAPIEGLDVAAAVDAAFAEVDFAGTWDDGATTTLSVTATVTDTELCSELFAGQTVVTVPVEVTATSADGRVVDLSGAGTVRVSIPPTGAPQLDLWLSTDLLCASETDTLPYRSVDCATTESVTAQLGFNDYGDTSPDGGRLELYVRNRQSTAAPGAADRVDTLTLGR